MKDDYERERERESSGVHTDSLAYIAAPNQKIQGSPQQILQNAIHYLKLSIYIQT